MNSPKPGEEPGGDQAVASDVMLALSALRHRDPNILAPLFLRYTEDTRPRTFACAARLVAALTSTVVLLGLLPIAGAQTAEKFPEPSTEVFLGPPADYEELLAPRTNERESPLRMLSVEERTGEAREDELVRVPVFFAAGECGSVDELAIVPADNVSDTAPIAIQADDVRRGPDGGVSRVHLWFATDLNPGEKRRFHLVTRRTPAPLPTTEQKPDDRATGRLRIATESGSVEFDASGALIAVQDGKVAWRFDAAGAFPRVQIQYPAAQGAPSKSIEFDRDSARRSLTWAPGALFTKVRLRIEDSEGVALEQVYRVPRHGRELILTSTLLTGKRVDGAVRENRLLVGRLESNAGRPTVITVPAGVRAALRGEHLYDVTAATARAGTLLAVPLVIGGANGRWQLGKDGELTLFGLRGLKHGNEGEQDTLHAFWTEVRLVPTMASDDVALWQTYRHHVQPLVAVVDEPGATVDELHRALSVVIREMKPVGWRQEAGRAFVLGGKEQAAKVFAQKPSAQEADAARLVRGAQNATAKLTNNGARKLREDEKGRAYGGLDPYHITYTQSAAAALAQLGDAPPPVAAANLAMARGVREFGGRTDAYGSPYIDCFSRTLNMQMGPVLFGLTAGRAAGDDALARFYRDLATAPAVQAVFGRGQRPYTGAPARTRDQSDYLYQAICDFWLRATELLGGEELHEHPLAYSRYTDCIDVLADQYHGVASRDKAGATGRARANFFRGQTHTHRWLGWSCAPYIRLLEDPAEHAAIGLTEAIRYTQGQKGRWKNWPDLTFYILADLLVREALPRYSPPTLPPAPGEVIVRRDGKAAALSWHKVPGAAEYRVYRAEKAGGPYRWLNSPYLDHPAPKLTVARYVDEDAPANVAYVVTAVDEAGRESRWPEALR